jgi:hypothetical protein
VTSDNQAESSICALSEDSFAAVWENANQEGPYDEIFACAFNATTKVNITKEFHVNDYTNDYQTFPTICALSEDTVAIAWESEGQDVDNSEGIYAKVFNITTGLNTTAEIQVNNYYASRQEKPSICALSKDKFVVAWSSLTQDPDGSVGTYARVFNATNGMNLTPDLMVNSYYQGNQIEPSICALSEDKFAVAWTSQAQDPDGSYGIYARVFNATNGVNMTSEFRVNYYFDNNQGSPSICSLTEDILAIAWYGDEIGPNTEHDIFARVFDATNRMNITRELVVNNHTENYQQYPAICPLAEDSFAVTWQSDAQDGSDYDVYGCVFFLNSAPEVFNPRPSNGNTNVDLNPILRVSVSDVNGQDLIIHFYDNTSGTPFALGFETVSSSEPEVVSLTWSDLEYNTEYKWFVNVSDGLVNTVSAQFSFTTKEEGMNIPGFLPMVFLPLTATIVLIAGIYISRQKTKNE